MEKFVDLANFLSALSFFCPLDVGILSLWLTGLCLILSLGYPRVPIFRTLKT